jgi:hypothetical protein
MESLHNSAKKMNGDDSTHVNNKYYFYNDRTTPIKDEHISMSILTSVDGLEVPTIYTKELESYESKGWRDAGAKPSDYFNYGKIYLNLGFTEETWEKYSKNISQKFSDLKKAIKEKRIQLPTSNVKKYLFNFPADYGGLGEILDEKKYENVNFFEYKLNKAKMIPNLEIRQNQVFLPLENKHENIDNNYNTIKNIPILNPIIKPGQPTVAPTPNLPLNPFNIPSYPILPNPTMIPLMYHHWQQHMMPPHKSDENKVKSNGSKESDRNDETSSDESSRRKKKKKRHSESIIFIKF